MTQPLQLNLDILHILSTHLETPELVHLSTTCKLYRMVALRRLVSSRVQIFTSEGLNAFCECILADAPTRARWIKSLDILSAEAFEWSDATKPAIPGVERAIETYNLSRLTIILKGSHTLTSLHIPVMGKTLNTQLLSSISSLTSMKELNLDIHDDSPLISELFCNMQSHLRVLRLRYFADIDYAPLPLRDPTSFVSTASIEVLQLYNVAFPPPDAQYSPWPSVREFHSAWSLVDFRKMPSILPSLRVCQLSDGTVIMKTRTTQKFQLWHDLDFFATAFPFENLRWRGCSIRRIQLYGVEIDVDIGPTTQDHMSMLFDLFRESQPLVLSFGDMEPQLYLGWRDVLPSITPSLRCLEFAVTPATVYSWNDNLSELEVSITP